MVKRRATLGALIAVAALSTMITASASARPPLEDEAAQAAPESAVTYGSGLTFQHTALAALASCGSGARTLSLPGSRVYPDQGNGGYTSLHTDLHIQYDTLANLFLPGTHADLTMRTTQCLTDFSFDFERTAMSGSLAGPNMTVTSITIDGQPAAFDFRQPTYPGNPNGPDDPDPAAHAISNVNPVSATNSNPPACSPQTSGNSQNGLQCPANKLVITPSTPIPEGATITVTINYVGRPGLHFDGDGTTEGWFRVNTTAAPNDGGFVTTEPVGNMAWMPLNNHPTAKPTYDVYDTVPAGKTAIGPGELEGATLTSDFAPLSPTAVNPPDANFPTGGSWLWHWHSPEPIASYLVENSIASYDLIGRLGADGVQYYQAQGSSILATRKALNKIAMDNQPDITSFQRGFNGPYPFTTAGVVVGIPSASFEEEMQTKITFAGGTIGGGTGMNLGTLAHENMHQWFGDNVAEGAFNLTFWKEGFARLGEYLHNARIAAGGGSSGAAFETSLVNQFNTNYGSASTTFWTGAPSNPSVGTLFTTNFTYNRPGTAYLALWRILGRDRMISAMQDIQGTYGGSSITEQQLEDLFRDWLPVPSASCNARLDHFFPEWWDTAFPMGTTGVPNTNKPKLSGPGLNGTGFVCAQVTPASPTGNNGWYTGDVSIDWQGYGAQAFAKDGCEDGPVTAEGTTTRSCSVTTTAAPILSSGAVSETVMRDSRDPVVTYTGNHGAYTIDEQVSIGCSASDPVPGSGLDSDTCEDLDAPAWSLALGSHTLSATAEDVAGNVGSGSATFTVSVTYASLENVVARFSSNPDVTRGLNDKLVAASKAKTATTRNSQLNAFENQVSAQTGKALTEEEARLLISFAEALK